MGGLNLNGDSCSIASKSSIKTKTTKANPYGFNYHSVNSLNKIKVHGEQPLHANDKKIVRKVPDRKKDSDDKVKVGGNRSDIFRTKPRDVPNYPHKFRYPINV